MNFPTITKEGKATKERQPMPKRALTTTGATIRGIHHTSNYAEFKTVVGNRKVSEYHIGLLMDSFQSNPELVELRPVLTNERLEVLDGQHRLEALRRLGLPVPYQIVPGGTLQTIQILNGTQLPWKLIDFVRSFAQAGNEEYKTLMDYNRRFPFSTRFMAKILSGKLEFGADKLIKNGQFTIREDIEEADSFLQHYLDVAQKTVHIGKGRGEAFVVALFKCWNTEGYSPDKMLEKLDSRPVQPQGSRILYLKEMEAVYNWKVAGPGYLRFL